MPSWILFGKAFLFLMMMLRSFIVMLSLLVSGQFVFGQQDFKKSPGGAFYKVLASKTGRKIHLHDVISFQAIQKTDKDSVLFSSYEGGHPIRIQVVEPYNLGDLMDVFPLLAEGDSVLVKVPADSLFKDYEDQRPLFLPSGSFLHFVLKIQKVQSLDEAMEEGKAIKERQKQEEITLMNQYIAASKYPYETTSSGLKYLLLENTQKNRPLPGDTVIVNYTGKLMDGRVFDSSIAAEAQKAGLAQPGRQYEPFQFIVGRGQVIQGWDEGLLLLREGAKAQFVIPSDLAYGSNGSGNEIKPYSTLIFEVQLLKVKPIKHEQPTVQPVKKPASASPAKKAVSTNKK